MPTPQAILFDRTLPVRYEAIDLRALAVRAALDRVRPGIDGGIQVESDRPLKLEPVAPGVYQIELGKGEEVWFHAGADPANQPGTNGAR